MMKNITTVHNRTDSFVMFGILPRNMLNIILGTSYSTQDNFAPSPYLNARVYVCVCVCVGVCVCGCVWVSVVVCVYVYQFTYTYIYIYICVYVNVYSRVKNMHTFIHNMYYILSCNPIACI